MSDETDTHTNNDFTLKAANSVATSRAMRGAGLGAGIFLLLGLFAAANTGGQTS